MNRTLLSQACLELGIHLSEEQLANFERFEVELYAANEVMNLTRVPQEEAWLRHFVDSLLFQDLIPEGVAVLDIGTGPGFPAWPLACARPDLKVVAIDSSGKMIGFLNTVPLSNLKTLKVRAEEWASRGMFDVVTGRAVAPLSLQLELSAPLLRRGGRFIPMRTPSDHVEVDASLLGLKLVDKALRQLPGTDIERLFPIFEKTGSTPSKYPRSWAEMKRSPLF